MKFYNVRSYIFYSFLCLLFIFVKSSFYLIMIFLFSWFFMYIFLRAKFFCFIRFGYSWFIMLFSPIPGINITDVLYFILSSLFYWNDLNIFSFSSKNSSLTFSDDLSIEVFFVFEFKTFFISLSSFFSLSFRIPI